MAIQTQIEQSADMLPAPEPAHETPERAWPRTAAILGAAALGGGIVGATIGAHVPAEVTLAPGVSGDVTLQRAGSTIDLAFVRGHLPHAQQYGFGVSLRPKPITLETGTASAQATYAQLFAQPNSTIERPIRIAELHQIARFASGMGALGFTAAASTAYWRRRKERAPVPYKATAVVGAAAVLLAGGISSQIKTMPQPMAQSEPLEASLAASSPYLRDAFIEGTSGQALNQGAKYIKNHIEHAKTTWQTAQHNFDKQIALFADKGGLAYLDQPHIVPILHVSDMHCNSAYYQNMLPALLRGLRPKVIANSGDTYLHTNTLADETNCASDLIAALRSADTDIPMVNIQGNHDPNEPSDTMKNAMTRTKPARPLITTLDKTNDYRAIINGVPFVGAPDLRRTAIGPTLPEDPIEQQTLMSQQGEHIADAACDVLEETGEMPVALGHNPAMLAETIARGCAAIALSGDLHIATNMPTRHPSATNRQSVIEYNIGSASGADGPMTIYSAPDTTADTALHLYNTQTHRIDRIIRIQISPDSDVSITDVTPAA